MPYSYARRIVSGRRWPSSSSTIKGGSSICKRNSCPWIIGFVFRWCSVRSSFYLGNTSFSWQLWIHFDFASVKTYLRQLTSLWINLQLFPVVITLTMRPNNSFSESRIGAPRWAPSITLNVESNASFQISKHQLSFFATIRPQWFTGLPFELTTQFRIGFKCNKCK
jgi:hypothetical protein